MAVVERGVSSGYHASGTTQVATFPSGIVVGDLLTLLVMDGYAPSIPSGWTKAYITPGTHGFMAWKIATAGDVSAGSVTYTISNSYRGSWAVVASVVGTFMVPGTFVSAAASSYLSASWHPAKAFDGVVGGISNSWASANATLPQWLQATLSTASAINRYSVACRTDDITQAPNAWTILGSNNGTDWDTLDTRSGIVFAAGEVKEYAAANTVAYLYYRINVTAVNGGSLTAISEFDVTSWWTFKDTSAALPQTAAVINVAAGQKAYYFATARADGSASGGTLNGSLGTVEFQRTADAYWMSALYTEDVASAGSRAAVWSSTTAITQMICTSFAITPTPTTTLALGSAATASDVTLAATLTATLALSATTTDDVALAADLTIIPTSTVVLDAATTDDTVLGADLTLAAHLPLGIATTGDDVALSADLTVTVLGTIALGTASTGDDVALAATLNLDLIHLVGMATGPSVEEIISEVGELDQTPPYAAPDADGLPPVGTLVTAPVYTVPGLPPILVEQTLTRCSVTVPAMTPDSQGLLDISDAVYDAYPRVEEDLGVPHVIVNGRDITYFRGRATQLVHTRQAEPFGDTDASFNLPQLTPFEGTGVGVLSDLFVGASMDVIMAGPTGIKRLWAGQLMSAGRGNDATLPKSTWSAQGTLMQASWFGHRVPTILDSTDIGVVVPDELNGVISRRFSTIAHKATGIKTKLRGVDTDSVLSYIQGLLATSWTSAGLQWVLRKRLNTSRNYELVLKDRATVDYTVTVGARGVEVDLDTDLTGTYNCIYGKGVSPDGSAWRGMLYPNTHPDAAPEYPYASAGTVMTIGSTDAGTLLGNGVSLWQRKVNELNLTSNVAVDGGFSSADAAVALSIQKQRGLLEDGIVGPQTWNATFSVGSGAGTLEGAWRKPLAIDPRVEPKLRDAAGHVTGDNPVYDKTIQRIERFIDYGSGVTRAEATQSAVLDLARNLNPGLTGRIILKSDPRQSSRLFITEGKNISPLGYDGRNPVLHIAAARIDWQARPITVTLEVDEHARDAMSVANIRARNKEARRDPASVRGTVDRRSSLGSDVADPFDGDSTAGIIPHMALYGGLWSCIYIPLSEVGRIAAIVANTSGPEAPFCISLFANPFIQPAHLVTNVGNPLDGPNPFERTTAKARALDALGYIISFGNATEAAGYWPRGQAAGDLTGELNEKGAWEYNSFKPPWVGVAIYAPTSCFFEARLRPTVNQ